MICSFPTQSLPWSEPVIFQHLDLTILPTKKIPKKLRHNEIICCSFTGQKPTVKEKNHTVILINDFFPDNMLTHTELILHCKLAVCCSTVHHWHACMIVSDKYIFFSHQYTPITPRRKTLTVTKRHFGAAVTCMYLFVYLLSSFHLYVSLSHWVCPL